jgi:hypothetical protein
VALPNEFKIALSKSPVALSPVHKLKHIMSRELQSITDRRKHHQIAATALVMILLPQQ